MTLSTPTPLPLDLRNNIKLEAVSTGKSAFLIRGLREDRLVGTLSFFFLGGWDDCSIRLSQGEMEEGWEVLEERAGSPRVIVG